MKKLHLGCAYNILNGWVNIDHPEAPRKKIAARKPHLVHKMDITRREGEHSWEHFEDDSVSRIYTEHTIEHIHYNEAKVMLQQCYRVLINGGRIRIATPDLKFLIDLYNTNKTSVQKQYIEYSCNNSSFDFVPYPIDTFVINNFVRDWGHIFIYDVRTLSELLIDCGFTDIRKYSIGKSHTKEFKNIDNKRDKEFYNVETFVVEARVPGKSTIHINKDSIVYAGKL